jgi:hypothetical protein
VGRAPPRPPAPPPSLPRPRSCIQRLLQDDQAPRGEDIECLCKLLSTVGRQLETPTVKGKAGMTQQQVRAARAAPCARGAPHARRPPAAGLRLREVLLR